MENCHKFPLCSFLLPKKCKDFLSQNYLFFNFKFSSGYSYLYEYNSLKLRKTITFQEYQFSLIINIFSKILGYFHNQNDDLISHWLSVNIIMNSILALNNRKDNRNLDCKNDRLFVLQTKKSSSSSDEKDNTTYYSVSENFKGNLSKTSDSIIQSLNPSNQCGTKPKIKAPPIAREGSSSDEVFLPQQSRYKRQSGSLNSKRRNKIPESHLVSSDSDDNRAGKNISQYLDATKIKGVKIKQNYDAYSSINIKSAPSQRNRYVTDMVYKMNSNKVTVSEKEKSHTLIANDTNGNRSFSTIENTLFLKRVEEVLSEIVEEKKTRILQRREVISGHKGTKPIYDSDDRVQRSCSRYDESRWILSKHYDTADKKTNMFSHIITSHGHRKLIHRSRSNDLLDTHSNCFSKLEPYKPRIIRKKNNCTISGNKSGTNILDSRRNITESMKSTPIPKNKKILSLGQNSRNEDIKSGESTTELNFTSNTTETDDTCYESEKDGSAREKDQIDTRVGGNHVVLLEPTEASVDSAYTGSRGPTPDDKKSIIEKTLQERLHHKQKHLQHKALSSDEALVTRENIAHSKKINIDIGESKQDKIRREIICEIRDLGIYSKFAIDTLIQLYKRKYDDIPKTDMESIIFEIYKKFNLRSNEKEAKEITFPDKRTSKKKTRFKLDSECKNESPKRPTSSMSCNLPNEAISLKDTIEKSKSASISWMSSEEIKAARSASKIILDWDFDEKTAGILKKATTWEEISDVLPVAHSATDEIGCSH